MANKNEPRPEKSIYSDLPVGFGMALMHNEQAYNRFAHLTEEEQRQILDGVHGISSKEEMRDYIARSLLSDRPADLFPPSAEHYAELYKNTTF